jgi:transposase-like protein
MRACPQCQSDRLVKNGSAAGKPKKQCKQCGYQFTRTTLRGKPLKTKSNAVLFYLSGLSMNRIAFLLRVSAGGAQLEPHLCPGAPGEARAHGANHRPGAR